LYLLSLSTSLPSVTLFLALFRIHALLAASINKLFLLPISPHTSSTFNHCFIHVKWILYYTLKKASFLRHVTIYGAISCFCFASVISLHFSLQPPTLCFLSKNTVLRHPTWNKKMFKTSSLLWVQWFIIPPWKFWSLKSRKWVCWSYFTLFFCFFSPLFIFTTISVYIHRGFDCYSSHFFVSFLLPLLQLYNNISTFVLLSVIIFLALETFLYMFSFGLYTMHYWDAPTLSTVCKQNGNGSVFL